MRDFVRRLLQYAVTGGIAAVVNAGGFVLNAKLSNVVASCLSFSIAALTCQFVFNRQATLHGFAPFMAAPLIGITETPAFRFFRVSWWGCRSPAAKLMGIAIAFIVNFLGNLRIVFHASRRASWRGACDPRMVSDAVATAVACQFALDAPRAFTIYRLSLVLR